MRCPAPASAPRRDAASPRASSRDRQSARAPLPRSTAPASARRLAGRRDATLLALARSRGGEAPLAAAPLPTRHLAATPPPHASSRSRRRPVARPHSASPQRPSGSPQPASSPSPLAGPLGHWAGRLGAAVLPCSRCQSRGGGSAGPAAARRCPPASLGLARWRTGRGRPPVPEWRLGPMLQRHQEAAVISKSQSQFSNQSFRSRNSMNDIVIDFNYVNFCSP